MGLLALDSGGGATLPEIAVLDTKGVWPILVSHLPVTRGGHGASGGGADHGGGGGASTASPSSSLDACEVALDDAGVAVTLLCPLSARTLTIERFRARCAAAYVGGGHGGVAGDGTLVAGGDGGGDPSSWWREPLCHVYVAAGDGEDVEAYKASIRAGLLAWCSAMCGAQRE